jgi:hypothetical protein
MSTPTLEIDGNPVDVLEAERAFHASMAAPEPNEPVAPAPPRVDQEAPYGRKADGTPRQRAAGPGRGKKTRTTATGTGKPKSETAAEVELRRREGVKGIVQIVSAGTTVLYMRSEDKAWYADTITLTNTADPMASAVVETCNANPKFAAIVDKVTAAGPYAALFSVTLGMAAQLAANHGIGLGKALGAQDPADVIAGFESASTADTA